MASDERDVPGAIEPARTGAGIADESHTVSVTVSTLVVGALAGVLGASVIVAIDQRVATIWLPLGLLYGAGATAVVGRRSIDPGRGLIWGVCTGFLTWVYISVILQFLPPAAPVELRPLFPLLIHLVLGFGAPVGLAVGYWQARQTGSTRIVFPSSRALLVGGLSGLVGGWAFGVWMGQESVFPLIARLVGSSSPAVGRLVHYLIAVFIGVSFGVLFRRDVKGYGSSLAWGMAYGLFWWVLGGITLLPLLLGSPVAWTADAASDHVGSLVGHVVYGLLLGLIYSVLDRSWLLLFHESDPLNREVKGAGIRTLRAAGWGLIASLGGGILFGVVMWRTGDLSRVAGLIGRSSPLIGFLVHMGISSIVGMTYGRLFRYESPDLGAGIAWGLLYGLMWWLVGPLTLLPTLLGEPLAWNVRSIELALPLLIGHLLYGAPTGAVFYLLERRQLAWARLNPRIAERERNRRRHVGTPAPAIWAFTLGMSILVIALLLSTV